MSLLTECLLVGGVALELVGAGVLSHSHNAESILELRGLVGDEGTAVGKPDALSSHAKLLAEKRVGFLLLTAGLTLTLIGLVMDSPEGARTMGGIAVGTVLVALLASMLATKLLSDRYRHLARKASEQQDPDVLPEQ